MILEEIFAILSSIIRGLTSAALVFLTRRSQRDPEQDNANLCNAAEIKDVFTCDKEMPGHSSRTERSFLRDQTFHNYEAIDCQPRYPGDDCNNFARSILIAFTIKMAALPLGILATGLLYLDLNTANLCFETRARKKWLPFSIKTWRAFGVGIVDGLIHLWFPVTLAFFFGWVEFKKNYLLTFYISFVFGIAVILSSIVSFLVFGVEASGASWYTCVGNALFFISMIYNSHFVSYRLLKEDNRLRSFGRIHIMTIISIQFFFGLFLAIACNHGIVPWFKETKEEVYKGMIASMTPLLAVIPLAVCKYFAIQASIITNVPGRSFVLLYLLHGLPEAIYRIMQSDVENIFVFIGLSVLHGFVSLAVRATEKARYAAWTRIFRCMCSCCSTLEQPPNDTLNHRRFKADIEILTFLFEHSAMILTQGYVAFYQMTNFQVSSIDVVREAVIRISIGVAIDFVFNCLSIFVQLRWYCIPIPRVWSKHWKFHMLTNGFAAAMVVCYSSGFLLNVIRDGAGANHGPLLLRNCSGPFSSL